MRRSGSAPRSSPFMSSCRSGGADPLSRAAAHRPRHHRHGGGVRRHPQGCGDLDRRRDRHRLCHHVDLVALIPYLVLQLTGLGIIVTAAGYGAIPKDAAIWIGAAIVTVYVIMSIWWR